MNFSVQGVKKEKREKTTHEVSKRNCCRCGIATRTQYTFMAGKCYHPNCFRCGGLQCKKKLKQNKCVVQHNNVFCSQTCADSIPYNPEDDVEEEEEEVEAPKVSRKKSRKPSPVTRKASKRSMKVKSPKRSTKSPEQSTKRLSKSTDKSSKRSIKSPEGHPRRIKKSSTKSPHSRTTTNLIGPSSRARPKSTAEKRTLSPSFSRSGSSPSLTSRTIKSSSVSSTLSPGRSSHNVTISGSSHSLNPAPSTSDSISTSISGFRDSSNSNHIGSDNTSNSSSNSNSNNNSSSNRSSSSSSSITATATTTTATTAATTAAIGVNTAITTVIPPTTTPTTTPPTTTTNTTNTNTNTNTAADDDTSFVMNDEQKRKYQSFMNYLSDQNHDVTRIVRTLSPEFFHNINLIRDFYNDQKESNDQEESTVISEFSDPEVNDFLSKNNIPKALRKEFVAFTMFDIEEMTMQELQMIVGKGTGFKIHKLYVKRKKQQLDSEQSESIEKKSQVIFSEDLPLNVQSSTIKTNATHMVPSTNVVHAVISHQWDKGFIVNHIPIREDAEIFWKKQPKMYSSILFCSEDGGNSWNIQKKKGVGAIDRIVKVHKELLSNKKQATPLTKEIIIQPGKIGITFEGNKINKVVPNSQADIAGVQVGWIIQSINGDKQPNNHEVIYEAIQKAQQLDKMPVILFEMASSPNTDSPHLFEGAEQALANDNLSEIDASFGLGSSSRTTSKSMGSSLPVGDFLGLTKNQNKVKITRQDSWAKLDGDKELRTMTKKLNFSTKEKLGMSCDGNKVWQISSGCQAEKAGVQVGWTIHSINGNIMPNDKIHIQNAILKAKHSNVGLSIIFN